MALNPDIGHLLFRNLAQGADRTLYHSSAIKNPSFQDALEMYCYRNQVHKYPAGAFFYMILGYLSTCPQAIWYDHSGNRDIFLDTDDRMIKVIIRDSTKSPHSLNQDVYKSFVINIDPTGPAKQLCINDYKSLEQETDPAYRSALRAAVEKTQYITIKRHRPGTIYSILTDEGTKTFSANKMSPFAVEIETLSIPSIGEAVSKPFMKVFVPEYGRYYRNVMENIPAIFQKTIVAQGLTSTSRDLLFFVQGALEFNFKETHNLQIRLDVNFFSNNYNRLFVQDVDKCAWVSNKAPILITTDHETDPISEKQPMVDIPGDFASKWIKVDVVNYRLSNQGSVIRKTNIATANDGGSILNPLQQIIEKDKLPDNLLAAIAPIFHRIELDAEYFFARRNEPRSKFFTNYILGQLLAYSGNPSTKIYAFKNDEVGDNRVSFVLKKTYKKSGVAIHIAEDSTKFQDPFLTPDYSEIGITNNILNIYIDSRDIRLTQDHRFHHQNALSRLPANSISVDYKSIHSTEDIDVTGEFRIIERDDYKYRQFYSTVRGRDKFLPTVIKRAVKAGLGPQSSRELEILLKSFCLGADRRSIFLPYPELDPSILGIKHFSHTPPILIKPGMDDMDEHLLDDLRSVYMGDQQYPQKKQAILRVVSAAHGENSEVTSPQEYTDGLNGPLYEKCIGHASQMSRFRRQSFDFCRSIRSQDDNEEFEMSEEYEIHPVEDMLQRYNTYRHGVEHHLTRVEQFSNALMQVTIGKNILGALLDDNYEEVAINVGFLAGSAGLGYASKYMAAKGTSLIAEGAKILGTSLRLASGFLARASSAFVAYDLYKQIEAYKSGNTDALVGVVGDSVVLTIDVVAFTIETFEAFGVVEGVSSVFGPIGAAIGAVIFIGVDVYQAVRTVEKIDAVIKLTAHERGVEGVRAFLHRSPEKYILDLMMEKQLNNIAAQNSIAMLKNMDQFKIYGAPALVLCKPSANLCTNGVKEVEDNKADFTKLRRFQSRTWPDMPNNFKTICDDARLLDFQIFARGYTRTVESWLLEKKTYTEKRYALECHGFQAVVDENRKNGTKVFINAGSGNDTIVGFRERSNIMNFTSGRKIFTGGDKPDTFIMHGEDTVMGSIDGGTGIDTLNFSKYAKLNATIEIVNGARTAHMLLVSGTYYRLDINNIENFIGRSDAHDKLSTNCRTTFVSLQGGTKQLSDTVRINPPSSPQCEYRLAVALWQDTNIWSHACSGKFSYELNRYAKPGTINLQNYCTINNTVQSVVKINMALGAISKLQRRVDDDRDILDIQLENGIVLFFIDFNFDQTYFLFENFNVQVTKFGIIGMRRVTAIENPLDTIQDLSALSHLNAVLVVEDERNKTKILMGHGKMISNAQNELKSMTNVNVLKNDLKFEHSIFVSGNDTENVFHIEVNCQQISICQPTDTTIYLQKNKTSGNKDTIDFSGVYQAMRSLNKTLNISIEFSKDRLCLKLWMTSQTSENHLLGTVAIHNIEMNGIENRLTVMLNVPFYLHLESNDLILKPTSLSFPKEIKLIILQPIDVADFMTVELAKSIDSFLTILKANESHAILTNVLHPGIKSNEDNLFTLSLANYYTSEANAQLFDTLTLKFKDCSYGIGDLLAGPRDDIMDYDGFRDLMGMLLKM